MEVMGSQQFEQTETLIGAVGKTSSFGVSDDPMLMSMLSTGFYANPLRTMLQEVMFNAWDSHKVSGNTDKPIDIYINDTSGLIIRDYGLGIHDEDIVPTYCVYGNSTKRDDKNQTGGFGLGCKSPFAYGESFTVTSMHKGMKCMYLVSRVSDDNGGKPGLTPLLHNIHTEEQGLMVTVPLKPHDHKKTYEYIKSVLYLSGIKANIHMDDREKPELYEAKSLAPGEYHMDDRNHHQRNNIYAVYGGVSYLIPQSDEYIKELRFVSLITNISNLYIGFAPNTLSPLPNREGLSMSDKTKENIRIGLEMCMERFRDVFEPMVHCHIRSKFDGYVKANIAPQFAIYNVLRYVDINYGSRSEFRETMTPLVPYNTDKAVWGIAIRLMINDVNDIISIIGNKRWLTIIKYHYVRCYPDSKSLIFKLFKDPGISDRNNWSLGEFISRFTLPDQLSKLHKFEKEIKNFLPNDSGMKKVSLKLSNGNRWVNVTRFKASHNRPLTSAELRLRGRNKATINPRKVVYEEPNQIWDPKDSEEILVNFIPNTVIIAKTVTTLNEVQYNVNSMFCSDNRSIMSYGYSSTDFGNIPGYVVNARKGGYTEAVRILTSMGYNVIEGEEPIKKSYDRSVKKITQYHRVDTNRYGWQGDHVDINVDGYDEVGDGIPLTDPTHYLYITPKVINCSYGYDNRFLKPGIPLIRAMMENNPDIVMVHSVTQAESFEKKGVKPFSSLVDDWFNSTTLNKKLFRNIVRILHISKSNLPDSLLTNKIIQQTMGIANINQDGFWTMFAMVKNISGEEYNSIRSTRKKLDNMIYDTWESDPLKSKINKNIQAVSVFNGSSLSARWNGLDIDGRENLAKSIARFVKSS